MRRDPVWRESLAPIRIGPGLSANGRRLCVSPGPAGQSPGPIGDRPEPIRKSAESIRVRAGLSVNARSLSGSRNLSGFGPSLSCSADSYSESARAYMRSAGTRRRSADRLGISPGTPFLSSIGWEYGDRPFPLARVREVREKHLTPCCAPHNLLRLL